jgi:hypothetical protein
MPYCDHLLIVEQPQEIENLLSRFAIEQCNANRAHALDPLQFNVDGGLNDLRAIRQANEKAIGFFCRHSRDLNKTTAKILQFSKDHDLECKAVKRLEFA